MLSKLLDIAVFVRSLAGNSDLRLHARYRGEFCRNEAHHFDQLLCLLLGAFIIFFQHE